MLITGKNFAKSRKAEKNNPNVNRYSPISYIVGWNIVQLDGI